MLLNLADPPHPLFFVWIAFTQEVQRIMGVVHWTKFFTDFVHITFFLIMDISNCMNTRARLFKILDKVVHWTTTYPVGS
jgi:hypothetical protein